MDASPPRPGDSAAPASPANPARADVGVHLQDERAGVAAVRVAVDLHDPGRGVEDVKVEGVEDQVGAEPDVETPPGFQLGPERGGKPGPGLRVRAVGGDDKVEASRKGGRVRAFRAECRAHPGLGAAALEDGEQPVAADGGEAVPARGGHGAAIVHVDVVPAARKIPRRLSREIEERTAGSSTPRSASRLTSDATDIQPLSARAYRP